MSNFNIWFVNNVNNVNFVNIVNHTFARIYIIYIIKYLSSFNGFSLLFSYSVIREYIMPIMAPIQIPITTRHRHWAYVSITHVNIFAKV